MFWLRSTEMMPPRMISPLNAASLSAKPMTAVVKVSNLSPIRGSAFEDEDQLQKLRRAPHEPDVEPSHRAHRPDAGEPHWKRQHEAQEQADRHGKHGDLDGEPRAFEQERRRDVAQELAKPREEGAGLGLLALFALGQFLERDAPGIGDAVADENQQDPEYARDEQGPAETLGERHLRYGVSGAR